MRVKKVFAVLLILLLVSAFAEPLPTTAVQANKLSLGFSTAQLNSDAIVDVIVELQDEPVIVYQLEHQGDATLLSISKNLNAKEYEKFISEKQLSVYSEIKNMSPDAKIGYRYQLTYNGFALAIRGVDIAKVAQLKGVKKIFPSKTYYALDSVSNSVIGADQIWTMKDSKGNPVDGTGVVIAIIDTGVDYKHPDLGGGFGPNYKVIGGYDFGDNDNDPMDLEGHGTHVAGIAAADGVIKGVAPKAKLLAYKIVKGDESSASSQNIVAAVERAVKDGANVINLSFGEAGGSADPEDPENQAFNNAADAGVLSAVAAGNDGSRCQPTPYPISKPSTASKVISVAASDDGTHPYISITNPVVPSITTITGNYADLSPKFLADKELEVVLAGYGRKSDFANVDVKGKIALVSRGPIGANAIYFRDKDLNAEEAGALGIIIYNNMPGIVSPTFSVEAGDDARQYIPAIFLTQSDGLSLKGLISKGLKVKFGEISGLSTIAEFSSMGPSADVTFKPEIAAPGVGIYSTLPGGKYASWNGTSMATPHVAGAIALVKQMHPDWKPADIKAAFMNTATILSNYQNNETISWTLQGSGRINIPAAINTKGIVEPSDLITKSDSLKPVQFTITNTSGDTVTYNLSYGLTLSDLMPATAGALTVAFSPSSVTLNKGETKTFTATFTADNTKLPKGANEGVIWLDPGGQKLHIPFVIWNGDIEIPEKLSLVNVSSNTISPGATQNNTMTFDYVMRSGSLTPATEANGKPKNSNIIDEMIIKILDTNNKELGVVYSKSLVLLGHYSVNWDGRDIYGNYFLPDGQYKWVIAARESNNDQQNPVISDAATLEGLFTVVNAPKENLGLTSSKAVISQEETSTITVQMNSPTPASALKGVIAFDPNVLSVVNVAEGTFFSSNGATAFKSSIDNIAGEVSIDLSLKDGKTASGQGNLISLTVKGRLPGDAELYFKESTVLDKDGKAVLTVFMPSYLTVQKAENPWDLNRDKKVDDADLALLTAAFGSEPKDANYLPLADFNMDGVIDGKDLVLLMIHYGQTYP
jgi:minor extracellular serine protease Vpr